MGARSAAVSPTAVAAPQPVASPALDATTVSWDAAPVPTLRYMQNNAPCQGGRIRVGEDVRFEPRFGAESERLFSTDSQFSVQPPLPEGLNLDPYSGVVSGSASAGCSSMSTHILTVSFSTELSLQIEGGGDLSMTRRFSSHQSCGGSSDALMINEDFARKLEHIVDAAGLLPEPVKAREYGNWMIWMVHRAWIDDESLIELDFTSMHMPPCHNEKRIAPKLMRAMATNTHLEVLSLSNSNLERAAGLMLAEALRQNGTLLELDLASNWLDSNTVRELALAIQSNPKCALEHFRVSPQKQMGQFFGRPTEQAVGEMMQTNETIVKLGFDCDDAHWRNVIDRALLRNNDYWRKRQSIVPDMQDLPAAEEKSS